MIEGLLLLVPWREVVPSSVFVYIGPEVKIWPRYRLNRSWNIGIKLANWSMRVIQWQNHRLKRRGFELLVKCFEQNLGRTTRHSRFYFKPSWILMMFVVGCPALRRWWPWRRTQANDDWVMSLSHPSKKKKAVVLEWSAFEDGSWTACLLLFGTTRLWPCRNSYRSYKKWALSEKDQLECPYEREPVKGTWIADQSQSGRQMSPIYYLSDYATIRLKRELKRIHGQYHHLRWFIS